MLAPILFIVYNRPEHTRRTIEALKKNYSAKESELHVFSDAAKDLSNNENVNKVRQIVHNISGFKNINIYEGTENQGCKNSVINAINTIIKRNDRFIVVEDDILTSDTFLDYMNRGLEFYKNDDRIFTLSGFGLPIKIPKDYKSDIYLSYRPGIWGWGSWSDRMRKVDWEVKDYNHFIKNSEIQNEFNRGGEDLSHMLIKQMNGQIDTWDVQLSYSQFLNKKYSVCPVFSQTENIGIYGVGTHFKTTQKKYLVKTCSKDVKFVKGIQPDERILKRYRNFFKKVWYIKIIKKLFHGINNEVPD